MKRASALAAGLALAFALAACSASDEETATRTFDLGLIDGAQGFIDFVMERQAILDQFGLQANRVKSLSPPNLHLMLAERQVDIGFAGFTTMAAARTEGKDVIVIHGVFSPVNMVFVRQDSAIRSLSDLKGKKIGLFGGPGSTTFGFLAILGRKWYGTDFFQEVELFTAPGPALIELLKNGELDAALLGTTESIQLYADPQFRVLVDLSEEFRQRHGRAPAHVTLATNEQFAGEHPDIVRDYLRAYKATVEYIETHPEVWDAYSDSIQITDPAHRALLREKMAPNIVSRWDAEQIAVQTDYLQLVHEIIGDSALRAVPGDLIRNDYLP